MDAADAAAERKRKRLEAWRKRQQTAKQQQQTAAPVPPPTPAVKVSLSLSSKATKKLKQKKKKTAAKGVIAKAHPLNPFGTVDDDDVDGDDHDSDDEERRRGSKMGLGFMTFSEVSNEMNPQSETDKTNEPSAKRRRKGRWDSGGPKPIVPTPVSEGDTVVGDALDKFMDKLEAGALGSVATQVRSGTDGSGKQILSIDVGGSMMRGVQKFLSQSPRTPISGGVITSDEIAKLSVVTIKKPKKSKLSKAKQENPEALYTASDWESGAGTADEASETDDDDKMTTDTKETEEEEKARRAFIEALKSATGPQVDEEQDDDDNVKQAVLASEVKNEKSRREQKFRDLKREAETARSMAERQGAPEIGRLYNDIEGGVMEEAERNLDAAMAAPDALQVLAELNKKKELKSVDHSAVEYIPFKKNLFIVPRAIANLTSDEVANLRGKLKVKVRGRGAPAPVATFEQCGLSERIMRILEKQNIRKPFPIQAQCLPCIMVSHFVLVPFQGACSGLFCFLLSFTKTPLLTSFISFPFSNFTVHNQNTRPVEMSLELQRQVVARHYRTCYQCFDISQVSQKSSFVFSQKSFQTTQI